VLDGSMPSAIPDTHLDPVAVLLPVTVDLHIGSYVGVPLRGADGTPTGMLCAAAGSARPELGADDVTSARLIADVVEDLRRRDHGAAASRRRRKRLQETVLDLCRGKGRRLEFQPIVHLPTGTEVAAEALTRFDDPARNPAQWFATATALGLGRELEVAVATSALKEVRGVLAVSINMSPQVIVDGGLDELLAGRDPHGVIVEVTEHAPVASYAALEQALAPHRERGLRVAVDDVGAGYASLAHVLEMHPDILKIDMSLVRDVDSDVVRQSLVASIGAFGAELGATVVAEGVETEAERDVLVRLGVDHAQGFLFHP
jgi:EAL domain-containing protein (putative c-di-GMP-specific phosphodiesterase class I)